MDARERGYRDLAVHGQVAIGLLYAYAAASLADLFLRWRRGFDPWAIGGNEFVFTLFQIALFLITAVAVLSWIYRANRNARAMGADDMMVTPGWAVGWFFVPLAHLVMPYVGVRDMWKASGQPRDWQFVATPLLIPLWWAFWIASGILQNIAFMLSLQEPYRAAEAADFTEALSSLLAIPAALLLTRIIGGIQRMQASPAHLAERFS